MGLLSEIWHDIPLAHSLTPLINFQDALSQYRPIAWRIIKQSYSHSSVGMGKKWIIWWKQGKAPGSILLVAEQWIHFTIYTTGRCLLGIWECFPLAQPACCCWPLAFFWFWRLLKLYSLSDDKPCISLKCTQLINTYKFDLFHFTYFYTEVLWVSPADYIKLYSDLFKAGSLLTVLHSSHIIVLVNSPPKIRSTKLCIPLFFSYSVNWYSM